MWTLPPFGANINGKLDGETGSSEPKLPSRLRLSDPERTFAGAQTSSKIQACL